jgi:hypothetical protein
VLLLLLHIVKLELDPSWHFISEYEIGKYGWIMQVAFLALALGNVALFVAVRDFVTGLWGRLGSFLFLVGAFGLVLGGIFTPDAVNTAPDTATMSGKLHNLGGALGLAGFLGTLIYSAMLLRDSLWSPLRRQLWLAATILILGFLVSSISIATIATQSGGVFGPDTPVGWPNRVGIVAGCTWLMIVSWCAATMRGTNSENLAAHNSTEPQKR